MIRQAALILSVPLLVFGCSPNQEEAATEGPAPPSSNADADGRAAPDDTAPANAPVDPTEPASPSVREQQSEANKATESDAIPTKTAELDPQPVGDTADFAADMARVHELERDARFAEALLLCRQMRARYRSPEAMREIGEGIVRLNRYSTRSGQLRYALRQLAAQHPDARTYARRTLLDAGELGRILLRKAVRDREDMDIAVAAAETLASAPELDWLPFFVKHLSPLPAEPLRGILLEEVAANAERLPLDSCLALMDVRNTAAPEDFTETVATALRTGVASLEPTPEQLAPILDRALGEEGNAQRSALRFLGMVYVFNTRRGDTAFDRLFGAEGGTLERLRQRLAQLPDGEHKRPQTRRARLDILFAPIDYEALATGLVAYWGLETLEAGVYPDIFAGQRPLRVKGDKPMPAQDGVIGKTVRFQATDTYLEMADPKDDVLLRIQDGSYSFAAWVKADGVPNGQQPDPYWGIVYKNGWHLGLEYRSDATFQHVHFYQDRRGAAAKSRTKCKPGTWYHLVGTVDQKAGKVRLFVDGELEGEASFPANAGGGNSYRREPIRVGAAREARMSYACRWRGLIDEIAIYRRALPPEHVRELYNLRALESRMGLRKLPEDVSVKTDRTDEEG